jgi:hypothetical protein
VQRATGGDDVIHDQDALAVHIIDILLVDDKGLLAGGGDGLILDDDRLFHVELGTLAGGDPVLAALAGHLVSQGDQRSGLRQTRGLSSAARRRRPRSAPHH